MCMGAYEGSGVGGILGWCLYLDHELAVHGRSILLRPIGVKRD